MFRVGRNVYFFKENLFFLKFRITGIKQEIHVHRNHLTRHVIKWHARKMAAWHAWSMLEAFQKHIGSLLDVLLVRPAVRTSRLLTLVGSLLQMHLEARWSSCGYDLESLLVQPDTPRNFQGHTDKTSNKFPMCFNCPFSVKIDANRLLKTYLSQLTQCMPLYGLPLKKHLNHYAARMMPKKSREK